MHMCWRASVSIRLNGGSFVGSPSHICKEREREGVCVCHSLLLFRSDCVCVRARMCCFPFIFRSVARMRWAQITIYNSAFTCQAILSFSRKWRVFFHMCASVFVHLYKYTHTHAMRHTIRCYMYVDVFAFNFRMPILLSCNRVFRHIYVCVHIL